MFEGDQIKHTQTPEYAREVCSQLQDSKQLAAGKVSIAATSARVHIKAFRESVTW